MERYSRRDLFEDLAVVVVTAAVALLAGIRIESVYLHDHEPVKCSTEDEISVELVEDGYGYPAGTLGCVHIDALVVHP